MLQISTSANQTIGPGQSVVFDRVLLKSGCAEACCSGVDRLIPVATMTKTGTYELEFYANLAVTTVAYGELTISVDGVPLPETRAVFLPATANTEFSNLARATLVTKRPVGCCDKTVTPSTVTVTNTGTSTVIVGQNSTLIVKRVSG